MRGMPFWTLVLPQRLTSLLSGALFFFIPLARHPNGRSGLHS